MWIERVSNDIDYKRVLEEIGVDGGGVNILASKMRHHLFYIKDLHVGAANILKQDALSIGADLAVPKGTVVAKQDKVDAILIVTQKQLVELSKKELAQPFGLKELAHQLKLFSRSVMPKKVDIMGIVNANEDSFFEGSRFKNSQAVGKIYEMLEQGASIIDIGGVSSRPGSAVVSAQDELERIKPIVDALYEEKIYEKTLLSIDSYESSVISYVLERGFKIVNDITGLADDEVCRLCASYGATAVIMHMKGTPQDMQKDPVYDNVVLHVEDFFKERIAKAKDFGIKDIVLDVGIGFGKRLSHNLELIKNLEHFLYLGYPLLVGASRKSMINEISKSETKDRLAGTLALHLRAIDNGASIIRAHDVYEHVQALHVRDAFYK
ncbi:dihydropteroate synthase [bacterium]|nr:dihydropteroate synthase [bacterium]MBU1883854.1 dihydropteroate synthase [bacterium]